MVADMTIFFPRSESSRDKCLGRFSRLCTYLDLMSFLTFSFNCSRK
jgi:hypothetical protein